MKPILRWPGAKWRIADWIISQFPAREVWFGAVLWRSARGVFRKPPSGTKKRSADVAEM